MSCHKTHKILLAAAVLLGSTTLTAEASLTAGIADGKSVVYSSVSDITWTGDANLLGTLESAQGYNTVVAAVIAVSPRIHDTSNYYDTPSYSGYHDLSSSDFDSSSLGRVTWFGAQAFTTYLNSISYAGSTQWALPSAGADPKTGWNQTGGQFGQLYYNELNALANPDTNGSDYGILHDGSYRNSGNAGPFVNAQTYAYWLGTEDTLNPFDAWFFGTDRGFQGSRPKNFQFYAWAVSPGNVAAVPVPGAVWLFGSGLLALLGLKRRGNIG